MLINGNKCTAVELCRGGEMICVAFFTRGDCAKICQWFPLSKKPYLPAFPFLFWKPHLPQLVPSSLSVPVDSGPLRPRSPISCCFRFMNTLSTCGIPPISYSQGNGRGTMEPSDSSSSGLLLSEAQEEVPFLFQQLLDTFVSRPLSEENTTSS